MRAGSVWMWGLMRDSQALIILMFEPSCEPFAYPLLPSVVIRLPDCPERRHQSPFPPSFWSVKVRRNPTHRSPRQPLISVLTACDSYVTLRLLCCHVGHFLLLKGCNDLSLPGCISKIGHCTHVDIGTLQPLSSFSDRFLCGYTSCRSLSCFGDGWASIYSWLCRLETSLLESLEVTWW